LEGAAPNRWIRKPGSPDLGVPRERFGVPESPHFGAERREAGANQNLGDQESGFASGRRDGLPFKGGRRRMKSPMAVPLKGRWIPQGLQRGPDSGSRLTNFELVRVRVRTSPKFRLRSGLEASRATAPSLGPVRSGLGIPSRDRPFPVTDSVLRPPVTGVSGTGVERSCPRKEAGPETAVLPEANITWDLCVSPVVLLSPLRFSPQTSLAGALEPLNPVFLEVTTPFPLPAPSL
jgi:hypothetical protein